MFATPMKSLTPQYRSLKDYLFDPSLLTSGPVPAERNCPRCVHQWRGHPKNGRQQKRERSDVTHNPLRDVTQQLQRQLRSTAVRNSLSAADVRRHAAGAAATNNAVQQEQQQQHPTSSHYVTTTAMTSQVQPLVTSAHHLTAAAAAAAPYVVEPRAAMFNVSVTCLCSAEIAQSLTRFVVYVCRFCTCR